MDEYEAQDRRLHSFPTWVYIIQCKNNHYYIGITGDLSLRLSQHATGDGAAYTREHGYRRVVYLELHSTRGAALDREEELQKAVIMRGCQPPFGIDVHPWDLFDIDEKRRIRLASREENWGWEG